MTKVKITLDTRSHCKDKDGKYPVLLRISHNSKTRDINFNIHSLKDKFNELTGEVRGIQNAVRHSKRIQKTFSDIDLWLDENKALIKLWQIGQLKDEIEKKFFKKQSELNLLEHSAKMLYRFTTEGRYSTAASYEDSLKILVKYRMKLAKKDDYVTISRLFNQTDNLGFTVKEEYKYYDMPIKAFNVEVAKDFKAYLSLRMNTKNAVYIHLRSLQSIFSDAEKSYPELKGHKPFEGMKKVSIPNTPVVLTSEEVNTIREMQVEEGSSKFHIRNYFLFMFNNMGMNFYDLALVKVHQFDGERLNYTRKKTEREGDDFSIKQNSESLKIIEYYINGKEKDDYLFPIIPKETLEPRIFRVKQNKVQWFNKHMKEIAQELGIEKKITTYTARDTWTNIGLGMGIDIRKISSGLGHSSVVVTEKHYSQMIQEKILDEINSRITQITQDI